MAGLSTHVLDTARGLPGAGMRVVLYRIAADGARQRLVEFTTNAQGRQDGELLPGEAFQRGSYELEFHAGDYFRAAGVPMADPPFLDVIPLRFGIAETSQHYHVPLLVSPWSCGTYRGG